MSLPTALWSPRQQRLALITDPNQLRDCRIYLIITRDPWAGVAGRLGDPIVGYVGETWRTPAGRLGEHLKDQWWSKDIIGYLVHPTIARNKAEAWAIEKRLIAEFETPYNKEFNGSSRWLIIDGVPKYRNDLPAQPSWWPRGDVTSGALGSGQPSRLDLWWARRRWWVIGSAVAWLALFVGACWLAAKAWDGSLVPKVGAGAATVPLLGLRFELWRRRIQAWRKRRRRRK